jgi:hypothetical protein
MTFLFAAYVLIWPLLTLGARSTASWSDLAYT